MGAQILTGGTIPEGPGFFYAPTVLAGLSDEMRIVQEETFGPVASLYRAKDREDALRIANQTTFGLSSAVWTNDAEEEEWFIGQPRRGRGVHQRHDRLVPGAAVRRDQALRVRA